VVLGAAAISTAAAFPGAVGFLGVALATVGLLLLGVRPTERAAVAHELRRLVIAVRRPLSSAR
jgi:hypothetical protein